MNTHSYTKAVQGDLASSFMVKVFSLVGLAMATSAIAVMTSWYVLSYVPFLASPLVSLIILLWLIFTSRSWAQVRPLNIILFLLIAYILWIAIAPLVAVAVTVWWAAMVYKAFFATACLSLAAWIYWATTHRDLSWMGWFLVMALIWVIVVWILQIFWPSPMVHMIVSWVSVVLFSAFIAYDINTLKRFPENMAIEAAIWLYLSIFNLFQSVLSLLLSLSND